jgi:hypothetical protein
MRIFSWLFHFSSQMNKFKLKNFTLPSDSFITIFVSIDSSILFTMPPDISADYIGDNKYKLSGDSTKINKFISENAYVQVV